MIKIAIKGHLTRGEDVIKILESLGGINKLNLEGYKCTGYYYIENNCRINCTFFSCLQEYTCYTLEEYEQTFLKTMENKRTIQIDLNTARDWYNQGGDLKKVALQAFTENELNALPKSWEEYCKINPYLTKGTDIFLRSTGLGEVTYTSLKREEHPGIIPSKERAEQFLILNKLLQIRDYYNQGWEPDWDNEMENKFVIMGDRGKLVLYVFSFTMCLFAFKTKELRDKFFQNFKEDLETIKEFL